MEEKKKNDLNRKNKFATILVIVAVVVVAVTAVLTFFVREGHLNRISEFVDQEVRLKTGLVERQIQLANANAQLLSADISRQLVSSEVTPTLVASTAKRYSDFFEYAGFTRSDGVVIDSLGDADQVEEDLRGADPRVDSAVMRISYNSTRFNQTILNFYVPVSFGDSVLGAVNAMMGARSKLRDLLDADLNGYGVIEVICDSKFNIMVSSKSVSDFGLPLRSEIPGVFADKTMELLRKNALNDSVRVFRFSSGNGEAMAGTSSIGNTGLYLVAIVPHESVTAITVSITIAAIVLALVLLTLLGIAYVFLNRLNYKARSESDNHLKNVIGALAESFGSVFEVNLDTGDSHAIRIAPVLIQKAGSLFAGNIKYNQVMAVYSNRMVVSDDIDLFEGVKNIDCVKESFAQRPQFDFVFRTPAGEGFHYIQASFVRPSKTRPEFVMGFKSVDDVMESEMEKRRKLNDQRVALEAALEKARSADQAKSKFLFSMSHDIRTPMNAVLGYDTLALRYLWELGLPPEQTEKLSRCLNNIQLSGKQLLGLINSVLNMARIESGELSLDEAPTVVAELTSEVAVTFEETARDKNIMLLVSRNLKHKYIVCDKVKMQQVILNVVSNAIKYTNAAGTVKVNFKEVDGNREGWCNIVTTVEDNGIGISESFLPHVFDDFEREKTATSSGVIGTGLGLSIVKKYVDLMGGTVSIESRELVGTKVVISTPHKIAENTEVTVAPDLSHKSMALQGKRVLLVEDNKMNREIAEEMLKSFGLYVECAVDGVDCIERISRAPAGSFDLVLMDIQMPRMDGYETTRTIRQMNDPLKANLLIYAMTANAFAEDQKESENAGMNGHISKPVDFAKFYNLLRNLFE